MALSFFFKVREKEKEKTIMNFGIHRPGSNPGSANPGWCHFQLSFLAWQQGHDALLQGCHED